jgi:hypothetical protein
LCRQTRLNRVDRPESCSIMPILRIPAATAGNSSLSRRIHSAERYPRCADAQRTRMLLMPRHDRRQVRYALARRTVLRLIKAQLQAFVTRGRRNDITEQMRNITRQMTATEMALSFSPVVSLRGPLPNTSCIVSCCMVSHQPNIGCIMPIPTARSSQSFGRYGFVSRWSI